MTDMKPGYCTGNELIAQDFENAVCIITADSRVNVHHLYRLSYAQAFSPLLSHLTTAGLIGWLNKLL